MTNLEIVKKELEIVAVDGHEFEAGKKIVKKLVFDNAGELSDCVMAIAKAKGIAKNSFITSRPCALSLGTHGLDSFL